MNRLKKAGITVLSLFLSAVLLALCACKRESDERLATVNGEEIRKSDVESMVKSMEKKYLSYGMTEEEFYGDEESKKALYEGVLEALIDQKLIPFLALQKGMKPLTEEELAEWYNQGNAELTAMREAAENNKDISLSDMLEFFGCTEDDYVEKYVDSKTYNLCYQYLSDLADIQDSDIREFYERLLEQQIKKADEDPRYLGNYLEEGSLLYYPDHAVCVEYLTLDENCPDTDDYEKIEAFYGEDVKKDIAVVFPGTKQFSKEIAGKILSLKPGEATERIEESTKIRIFRRMDDPNIPSGWEDLPEVLMASLRRSIGERYVAELLLQAREQGIVDYSSR